MAGSGAVLSVGNSLVAYLTAVNELARDSGGWRAGELPARLQCRDRRHRHARGRGHDHLLALPARGRSVFAQPPGAARSGAGPTFPLGLELHYLVTAWAANAAREHEALAWVMRELYRHPVLDRSVLAPIDVWRAEEAVHLVPTELSTEDMMRIWDAIRPEYRLSVTWCARVVRFDRDALADSGQPVVATRFAFGRPEPVEATDG